ncbi:MAG: hypothetical protein HKO67_05770 [Flavobacteriaceae bacterium]|nr:hypothetical protein [Flavobacteriaceae bacterium]
MTTTHTNQEENNEEQAKIFMSIDHLKAGNYKLHLLCKDKVIKTIKFKK